MKMSIFINYEYEKCDISLLFLKLFQFNILYSPGEYIPVRAGRHQLYPAHKGAFFTPAES